VAILKNKVYITPIPFSIGEKQVRGKESLILRQIGVNWCRVVVYHNYILVYKNGLNSKRTIIMYLCSFADSSFSLIN